nr:hypothetical protein [uncultured Treponema sp.]
MDKLQESFEKAINDLYTIDWSETDGSDVKEIFERYFDDIPNNKTMIYRLIKDTSSFNSFQKELAVKILKAC